MMNHKLSALYGLKYNPFIPEVPTEALYSHTKLQNFCWRIEHSFIREGGFAMITGEPGTGKSVALRLLAANLSKLRDVQVGALTHPSANLADFYRELGDIFSVPLSAHNRWCGFKNLRERWLNYLSTTLVRPILFIDEAQEMPVCTLNELRLLTSTQFDSRMLLSVVFAGDQRLSDKLRRDELIPLGSRIRVRYNTEHAGKDQLLDCLRHLLATAGNAALMTQELMDLLCDHAIGNYRILCTLCAELLAEAVKQERAQLDEKLYFECFATPEPAVKRRKS